MSHTFDQLATWLEDDGHPACATDLRCADPAGRPHVARQAADHCETDPRYHDGQAAALPGVLREWAAEQEALLSQPGEHPAAD